MRIRPRFTVTKETVFTFEFHDSEEARKFNRDAESRFEYVCSVDSPESMVVTVAFVYGDAAPIKIFEEFIERELENG